MQVHKQIDEQIKKKIKRIHELLSNEFKKL